MRKQIKYSEPIPQFNNKGKALKPKIEQFTVFSNNQSEYDAIMTAITDPERGITNIIESDLFDEPSGDPIEELLFRVASLELAQGVTKFAKASLERLTDVHKAEINDMLEVADLSRVREP
jgi:hypothetical protein